MPLDYQKLASQRQPLVNTFNAHREKLKRVEKAALWVTNNIGSVGFFAAIFGWTIFWIFWNTLAPANLRFDPYPAFEIWVFVANVLQLSLMPLILFGQNIQSRHAEIIAKQQYEKSLREEREIDALLLGMQEQNAKLDQILNKINHG